MRISIVPAQITTVEDKIAGNISVYQAILLGTPILFGFIVATAFPPTGQFVTYKIIIVAILFVTGGVLAIRLRDRIIADWLKLFTIYYARPLYYIYDKNSMYLRTIESTNAVTIDKITYAQPTKRSIATQNGISPREFVRLELFATDTRAGMKFKVGKKGKLNVHITEVK